MNYKKYNKRFIISFFILLFILAFLNITVDPYNIFNMPAIKKFNYFKPDAKRQERLTKFLNLKMLKNIDTIFCGVSRTDWSLEPEYFNKITKRNAANMAMAAADFNEFREIIYNSVKIHPEIKTVLLAVDIHKYMPLITEKTHFDINAENSNITVNEVAGVVFSADTTVSSFITLIKNLSNVEKRVYLKNGMKHIFYNKNIKNSFKGTINEYKNSGNCFKTVDINFEELRKLIEELKSKDIEVVLYIPPLHSTFLEIYDFNKSWDGVDKFKKELAKVQSFYDFMFVNSINSEEIRPDMKYYYEASHATYLAGRMILDTIFSKNSDYGHFVTLDNVDFYNLQNRKALKNWQVQNSELRKWIHSILEKK